MIVPNIRVVAFAEGSSDVEKLPNELRAKPALVPKIDSHCNFVNSLFIKKKVKIAHQITTLL